MNNKIKEMIIHVVLLYILPIVTIAVCGLNDDKGIVSIVMGIVLMHVIVDDLNNVKV